MPANRNHHKTKENKFHILVIPQGDAGEKRSFGLTLNGLLTFFGGLVVVIAVVVVFLLGYTPLGTLVPVSNSEIQRRYGDQLYSLQTRLSKISEEVIVMREYNHKLRTALGEDFEDDSLAVTTSDKLKEDEISQRNVVEAPRQAETETPAHNESPAYSYAQQSQVTSRPFQATFPVYPPVVGYVSRGFDEARRHFGIDYAGRRGAIISAAADGYVVFAGWTFDDGNMIILSHGSGYFTIYKHNQSLLKSTNDFVKRGQPIALLGNSGNTSYGPHLHFELWKDGQPQNPDEYLIATESL
jgi:murein DD-endopeptidase MepM/ murein hydrolase activator NlpD